LLEENYMHIYSISYKHTGLVFLGLICYIYENNLRFVFVNDKIRD